MKGFVILSFLIIAGNAATDQELWIQFKATHNKVYKSFLEEELRYSIFQNNLRIIEEHNARYAEGETTYTLGINKFADLTNEEFTNSLNYQHSDLSTTRTFKITPNIKIPPSADWRKTGAVLRVKDQQDCGSCWAFSSTGALEGQNYIKNNRSIELSEQYLIDCSTIAGNDGCTGGAIQNAFEYVTSKGIATEESYPYLGYDDYCKDGDMARISIESYTQVDNTEYSLAHAVASIGPISTTINGDQLHLYSSGILNNQNCSETTNHAVLVVGYDTENNTDYWIIKNSWGADWGEKGYFRIVREFQCGMGHWNLYPNIN